MQITKNRKYIQHLEQQGEGLINWEVWERVAEVTRQLINESFKNCPAPPKKNIIQKLVVYCYDNNGNEVKKYDSNKDCVHELGGNDSTIHKYSINKYIFNNLLLSREELTKDRAFALYRFALEHGKVYQARITKTKPKKTVYTYSRLGKMTGVYESLNQYCKCIGSNSQTKLRKRLLKGDIITKYKLLSYQFYDEEIAKEIYEKKSRNS